MTVVEAPSAEPVEIGVVAPEISAVSETTAATTCVVCGKLLTRTESVVRGIGPICFDRVKRFLEREYADAPNERPEITTMNEEQLVELLKQVRDITSFDLFGPEEELSPTSEEFLDRWISLTEAIKIAREAGKSSGDLVDHKMGGRRQTAPPMAPYWRSVYAHGKRWLTREALSHIDELNTLRIGARTATETEIETTA